MKLSLDWLSDFVEFSVRGPQVIAERLTLSVAEVEEVEIQGKYLQSCVVGKVLSVRKHPNADKLSLCDVATDRGTKRVVCGGTNLREGMLVAFAHIGAKVRWHGEAEMELQKTKIRGEESEGMICTAEELDLLNQFPSSKGRTIIDFSYSLLPTPYNLDVGKPLREALGLNDVIFHIDNHAITQRPDLFSHLGFARECVALELGMWKEKERKKYSNLKFQISNFPKDSLPFKLILDCPEHVPRYCSCLIHIDGLGETPEWMVKRLEAVGWRSLSLPIDITNYVATEIGVPLHSFDAGDFHGDVHMREAKEGERITTLDGVKRELPEGALVLSDNEGIFDLLGVMGGLRSSTKESTRSIFLHSASLDPISIRIAITGTGHRTDAATVYEKGVPSITAEQGFHRALELMLSLIPGARVISKLEEWGSNGTPQPIELSLEHASSLLGREISEEEATQILTTLDFEVNQKPRTKNQELVIAPPLHRLGDIHEPADLIEEIARIVGFTTFAEDTPSAPITPPTRDDRLHRMRDTLRIAGFTEVVQFAFLGESLLRRSGLETDSLIEVSNPLGEDMKYLRPSLAPRLLMFASENLPLTDGILRIFEVGHLFSTENEKDSLALLVAQKRREDLKSEAFLLAKSALCEALRALGIHPMFERMKESAAGVYPGRTVRVEALGKDVGALYEVHPLVTKEFDLLGGVAIAVLDLEMLFALQGGETVFNNIPTFPSIAYDTTLPVAPDIEVGVLLERARELHELLREITLVDLYQKGSERHLTFRCTYGAPDRTLTEEEVKPVHEKVEAMLRG